jgi:hypothetical protein
LTEAASSGRGAILLSRQNQQDRPGPLKSSLGVRAIGRHRALRQTVEDTAHRHGGLADFIFRPSVADNAERHPARFVSVATPAES